ncbi:protein PNS1-like [Papaver somniferum]|uniref:protein PNS1-like n=1 Tax=Papaver somniferum TaxID=3469 RepID=UPI000E702631|nr:protein PNS1-like [Papaver somniferum]
MGVLSLDTVVMKKEEAERDLEEGNNQVEKNRKKEKEDLNHIDIETDDDDEEEEEEEEEEEMKKFDEAKLKDKPLDKNNSNEFKVNMLQTLNPTNPLRIVIQGASQVPIPPPSTDHRHQMQSRHVPQPHPHPNTPPQQNQVLEIPTLNSTTYTNRISLFIFLVHMVAVIGLQGYLGYIAIEGIIKPGEIQRKETKILKYWLPQVEGAAILSIIIAFTWQKAMRTWPSLTLKLILWCSFVTSLAAGILLLVFQKPSTDVVGVALIAFAIGNGLYACWVSQRIRFTAQVLEKSLEPVCKFRDLNQPTYWMLGLGFIYITLWVFAIIGALNFYFPPLVIIGLVLSLAWTAEVLRNVANITVSRVIALYYLRGMQCSTGFCFQRALSTNLGSACLGSLFVPAIEALRIIARGLNLLEGEDEFMFSCAHCCLRVMDSIFRFGNSWAFVQIAAYGKGFVRASQDTWALFERIDNMEQVVDADITSSVCFLTGVCSGSICVIVTASWTFTVHKDYTATVSLLAFFLGYLLTRIGMALPHACVSCYYVCYAENPRGTLFGETIPKRLDLIKNDRDIVVPTPRVPRRFRD